MKDIQGSLDLVVRLLLSSGRCVSADLDRAALLAAEEDQRLDIILVRSGIVTERELAYAYSDLLGVQVADASRYPSTPLFTDCLKPAFLRSARICPLAIENGKLILAIVDGLDQTVNRIVSSRTGLEVQVEIAIPFDLEAALDRLYVVPTSEPLEAARFDNDFLIESVERLRDMASEAPVIRAVNQVIARAVEGNASDIHMEPFDSQLRIRYRFDGVLCEAESYGRGVAAAIVSRVKVMAKLDIAERRLPQDGRIKLVVRGLEVDLRVASAPSLYGESIVIRILDRSAVRLCYDDLGLNPTIITGWQAVLRRPNGIVLVTGPTGSGKTTTLYATLSAINSEERKIISIENPVEYSLHGIHQIEVKTDIGLSFAKILRTVLRHDPDIIMVGEIRDAETAEVAVQAAMTGHLVLSTLHTNSAVAALTRLRNLGVEDYLIKSVLRGVLAQRLVRRLCENCKRSLPTHACMTDDERTSGSSTSYYIPRWEAVGCTKCRNTGFKGRLAVGELLCPSDGFDDITFGFREEAEIERAATLNGMTKLLDAGMSEVFAGRTTLDEIHQNL